MINKILQEVADFNVIRRHVKRLSPIYPKIYQREDILQNGIFLYIGSKVEFEYEGTKYRRFCFQTNRLEVGTVDKIEKAINTMKSRLYRDAKDIIEKAIPYRENDKAIFYDSSGNIIIDEVVT